MVDGSPSNETGERADRNATLLLTAAEDLGYRASALRQNGLRESGLGNESERRAALRSEPVRDAVTDVFEDMHLAFLRAGDRGPEMLRECLWAALDAAGAAVFHAVRLMSPEQLAELIGGRIEESPRSLVTVEGWFDQRRAVGPWLPVIPVTHQGEETT